MRGGLMAFPLQIQHNATAFSTDSRAARGVCTPSCRCNVVCIAPHGKRMASPPVKELSILSPVWPSLTSSFCRTDFCILGMDIAHSWTFPRLKTHVSTVWTSAKQPCVVAPHCDGNLYVLMNNALPDLLVKSCQTLPTPSSSMRPLQQDKAVQPRDCSCPHSLAEKNMASTSLSGSPDFMLGHVPRTGYLPNWFQPIIGMKVNWHHPWSSSILRRDITKCWNMLKLPTNQPLQSPPTLMQDQHLIHFASFHPKLLMKLCTSSSSCGWCDSK